MEETDLRATANGIDDWDPVMMSRAAGALRKAADEIERLKRDLAEERAKHVLTLSASR